MTPARTPGVGRAGVAVAIGSGLANVFGYVFLVVLSRLYSPAGFGEVTALLTIATIASVPALALQFAVAREVARDRADGRATRPQERAGWTVGLVAAALVLLATPVLMVELDLPVGGLVAVAAMVVPFTIASSYLGLTLGSQRPVRYAVSLSTMAAVKLVTGAVAAVAQTSPVVTVWVLAGTTVIGAVALRLLSGHYAARIPLDAARLGFRPLLQLSAAVAAFLLLSSLDVLLARAVLSPEGSGLYAAGSLFTRVGIWGPQFVSLTIFPYVAAASSRRLVAQALALVAVLGVVGCAVTAVVGTRVLTAMSGEAYAAVGPDAWMFLALGVLLSVVNLALTADIARDGSVVSRLIWVSIAVEATVVLVWAHDSVLQVLTAATVVTLVLALVGCWRVLTASQPHPTTRERHLSTPGPGRD